jgi:hypothetical protein
MAAGVDDRIWTLKDIAGLLDYWTLKDIAGLLD